MRAEFRAAAKGNAFLMPRCLKAVPLSARAFARYGDVIIPSGKPDKMINQGLCGRYHDLARLDFTEGRAGISFFDAQERHLPLVVDMMERHPQGSQAFIPVSRSRYLIVVADDDDGVPTNPCAFLADYEQSVNLHRNVWHGVLTPVGAPGRFVVVDRIGDGANLEEYWFDAPYTIDAL